MKNIIKNILVSILKGRRISIKVNLNIIYNYTLLKILRSNIFLVRLKRK